MKNNPFDNYKPEGAAIFLEQAISEDGTVMVRCQLEGRGGDIVHMLAVAFAADEEKGGVLHQMITDAMEIGVDVDASEMKLRMESKSKKDKVVH